MLVINVRTYCIAAAVGCCSCCCAAALAGCCGCCAHQSHLMIDLETEKRKKVEINHKASLEKGSGVIKKKS
jgi:hypothetical protein